MTSSSLVKREDRNSPKKIKIIDPKKINVIKPDYLLLLSWNLVKEIMKQEKKYLKNNGKIIIPFPNPRLVKKY